MGIGHDQEVSTSQSQTVSGNRKRAAVRARRGNPVGPGYGDAVSACGGDPVRICNLP
jgi:hypothetical protein